MHIPTVAPVLCFPAARRVPLLAALAAVALALPAAAQADLDILASSQEPIAGSTGPLLGVGELTLGADGSWAATARVASASGTPEFAIIGDPTPDASQGAAVLRRPMLTSTPPQVRIGRPSILGGQLAYLGTQYLTPFLTFESAWLDDQLLAEEGAAVGSTGRTWGRLASVTLRPRGKVFLRGGTSDGGVLYAHHTGSVLVSVDGFIASLGRILRIERVAISPNGEHWAARVSIFLVGDVLLVDGALLSLGGAGAIESEPVGAALGLGASTWSSFGPMAVDDTGRVTVQAVVAGASSGELTVRGDRVIEPIAPGPPVPQFRGITFGSLAVSSNADAVYLEGEPIITGAATLDADGDGVADAGYALGTNTIGEADWQPLGSSDGFIGSVFIDVPGMTGDQQAVVRFQRKLQSTDLCDGVPNSTGRAAGLEAFGRSGAAANDLTLYGIDLPTGCVGYGIASQQSGFVANPGGSTGNLCLGGSIGRLIDGMFTVEEAGRGTVSLDVAAIPQPMGTQAAAAGDIWFLQLWYRDTCATGATSNFSDAVSVQFTD